MKYAMEAFFALSGIRLLSFSDHPALVGLIVLFFALVANLIREATH